MSRDDYLDRPPILVNSVPKSGTHLLLQVVQGLPGIQTYGAFLASKPTITFVERSVDEQIRKLYRIVPGEALPAHLFYDPAVVPILKELNILHFFIYRDPRDVVVSEAIYLTEMNRWHRLHRYFVSLQDLEERISTAILGIDPAQASFKYPNVAERFSRYAGWLNEKNAMALRFEDLIGERPEEQLARIARAYSAAREEELDLATTISSMQGAIDPEKSHTYRRGEPGEWQEAFSQRNREEMKHVAGSLLIELGYEQDMDW